MINSCLHGTLIHGTRTSNLPLVFCRQKSLTASIERGIRSSELSRPSRRSTKPPYRTENVLQSKFSRRKSQAEDNFSEQGGSRDRTRRGVRPAQLDPAPFDHRTAKFDSSTGRTPRFEVRTSGRKWAEGNTSENGGATHHGQSELGNRAKDAACYNCGSQGHKARDCTQAGRRESKHSALERREPNSPPHRSRHEQSGGRSPRGTGHDQAYSYSEKREPAAVSSYRQQVPESLPYTTAASEFLYGYSTVLAALKAGRRKLYKLYIHERGWNNEGRAALVARAKGAHVTVQRVPDEYERVLDKASRGRPHNGFILEASPLPQSPLVKLGKSSVIDGFFEVELEKQSVEDIRVNGEQAHYTFKSAGWRHPFVLYVDGVLDEGNLGAIARSAYFLGVDAIATPSRQSAPWSQIALKASAGAAEAIPIFSVNRPADFLAQSAREGWRMYASAAIPPEGRSSRLDTSSPAGEKYVEDSSSNLVFTYARNPKRLPADHSPVDAHPTVLMMGAEGTGLRPSLLNIAHYNVGIRAGRVDEVGVDSLNVSVAASLLCFEFLKKPKPVRKPGDFLF